MDQITATVKIGQHPLIVPSFFSLLVAGCATLPPTQKPSTAWLILDNHGGFSHAGRRIALLADNTYTDTAYTCTGDHGTRQGTYTLDAGRGRLVLRAGGRAPETLYAVEYSNARYWVSHDDRQRIKLPSEIRLRQSSLRYKLP